MAGDESGTPKPRSGQRKGDVARAERLRAALRENLKRRRAQSKDRAKDRAKGEGRFEDQSRAGAPHDSAGFVPEIVTNKPKR
jgi:hypothetical protein